MKVIDAFRGGHYFLSNFYPAPVPFRGEVFPTSAFHAILTAATPGDVKKLGRTVSLVADWDTVRYGVMYDVMLSKFTHNADLRERLLATRGALLVEGNTWHDQTWGSCVCPQHTEIPGDNALGVILMALRLRLGIGK